MASRGGTPTGIGIVQLDIVLEHEFIVLLSHLSRKVFVELLGKKLNVSLPAGTSEGKDL